MHAIWQDYAIAVRMRPEDGAEWRWWQAWEAEREALKADQCPGYDAWLEQYAKKHGGVPAWQSEPYLHCVYLDAWRRKNRPVGICARVLSWEKQYFQLLHCQSEWIGLRAGCCNDPDRPAVPIGCNHRLCPLCNWRRSQKAQLRIKKVFDRIEHPQFLTFTVPNVRKVSKRTFEHIRKRVKQFFAQHREFNGGVYSIETTFNKQDGTWHVHAHALASNACFKLPKADQRIHFAGRNMRAFDLLKLSYEYDWSRLWCKDFAKQWSARPRKNAKQSKVEEERTSFEVWVRGCYDNRVRVYRGGKWVPIWWLSDHEMGKRRAWNLANRRVFWIRPVDDRDKAAKEVLKYITKSADFVHDANCVRQFQEATKGARMIQCFGDWYGIDFSADFDTAHVDEDCKSHQCACGVNEFNRMGVFQRRDVYMARNGHWYLKQCFDHNARGTNPRPTIRALSEPGERTGDQPCQ